MIRPLSWKDVALKHEADVLEEFVDKKYGIVKNLVVLSRQFQDPNMYVTSAITSKPWNTGLFPGRYFITEGTSVNEALPLAVIGSLGESLERYCAIYYDKSDMVFGSYNELVKKNGIAFIDPDVCAFYAREQEVQDLEFFCRDSKVYWTEGHSLVTHKPVMVPAQLVYLPYFRDMEEAGIYHPISTGLAFGITPEDTVYSGLMEAVERDSFAIFWLNKLALPRISPPFGVAGLDEWYDRLFGDINLEINVFDITTDVGIPAFVSYLKGRREYREPFLSVGAAAALDPVTALKKAVMESYHTRKYGFSIMYLADDPNLSEIRNTDSLKANRFLDHVSRYVKPVDLDEIDFLYSPAEKIPFRDVYDAYRIDDMDKTELLRQAVGRLSSKGYEPIIKNVTSEDVAEKLFYSIKTIVPGLHPLWAGPDIPLGGRRIYDVPVTMGFKRKTMQDMNLVPHSFP